MLFFPTKKELRLELEKIQQGFKTRDETIKELRDKIETNSLKLATIEGVLLNKYQIAQAIPEKSQEQVPDKSQAVPSKSQAVPETFETRIIKQIKHNKKALVMSEILKLWETYNDIEIFNIIVKDKKLCSKASFYRYLASLKTQELETKKSETRKLETLRQKRDKIET